MSDTQQTHAGLHTVRHRRQRRLRALERHRDTLEASVWLFGFATMAFFLASGPVPWYDTADAISSLGRLAGLAATVLLLIQVVLASRAPVIERALGHDAAVALHASIGQPAIGLLVAHGLLLTVGWAWSLDRSILAQSLAFLTESTWIALGIVGLGLLVVVAVTSIMAVRRRWSYEVWHAVHLAAYAGVALSVPHQFFDGTTLLAHSAAAWMWASAYVIAFGMLLVWRVGVPIWRGFRHRLVVDQVRRDDDGTVTLSMTGRNLARWDTQPGQFLLWRFWTRSRWWQAHPYSLSAAPDGQTLRITVAPPRGDAGLMSDIRRGTRVSASGPYGLFTHEARTSSHLVLVAAGVGVTPIRALLEDPESALGDCDVIVRARSPREMPLLAELADLAAVGGARLHTLWGHRSQSWLPAGPTQSIADVVPGIADSDVFICGPAAWADAVERDARQAGVPSYAVHRDTFGW